MDKLSAISHTINASYTCIHDLFKTYSISQGNADDQQYWSNLFQQEILRHLTAEQIIPFRQLDKDLSTHDDKHIKNLLFFLETTSFTDPQYGLMMKQLMESFRDHIKRVQEIWLPKLEHHLTFESSRSLALSFEQTKKSSHLKIYSSSAINAPL